MTRHLIDKTRSPTPARAGRYLELDRQDGQHPATRTLHRRTDAAAAATTPRRMQEFLRIDRGHSV